MAKRIYRFSAASCEYTGDAASKEAKALLGGKGAGLVRMSQKGLNVPPGFTVTTEVCNAYRSESVEGRKILMDILMDEVEQYMGGLTEHFGYRPLVSVRSGAPVSMPGMMDTILNVGLTSDGLKEWVGRIGERAAEDSLRRLIQMLGATAYLVPMSVFDFQLAKVKKEKGKKADTDLTAAELHKVAVEYLIAFNANTAQTFPINDWREQLRVAIQAVFRSWDNARAVEYRKINGLSDAMGTAVTVQAMVFGNMGDDSGSGVLFTRNPSTGEDLIMGEYLANAQGEDVVAGIRTPVKLDTILKPNVQHGGYTTTKFWAADLAEICAKLEDFYGDMVDVEFTVQKGELFILQSREGKRSARAAFKIAVDLVKEGVITREVALKRVNREQFKVVRRKSLDPSFKVVPDHVGLPACPGIVTGRPVFSAKEAVSATDDVILVTHETNPNDIAGMAAAKGILTQTGGATSHAAVVARAMDKACVVGCTGLKLDALKTVNCKKLTLDGSTGNVWFDIEVPTIAPSNDPSIVTVSEWALDKGNFVQTCEPTKTPLQGRPVCFDLHPFWGDKAKLKELLIELSKVKDKSNVVLNIASPVEHMPKADAALQICFGVIEEYAGFKDVVINSLVKNKAKLEGVIIYGAYGHEALVAAGYPMAPSAMEPVPVDYAVFTALS